MADVEPSDLDNGVQVLDRKIMDEDQVVPTILAIWLDHLYGKEYAKYI